MSRTESDSADRFRRALDEFVRWRETGEPASEDEFLGQHEDLRADLELLIARAQGDDSRPAIHDDDGEGHRILGQFRILREIGRGAMGTVFEASQLGLGRRVAIKTLPAGMALSDEAVERFRREARTAAKLRIPGVAQVYGAGKDGRTHYLAMELVVGAPLSYLIEEMRTAERPLTGDDVMFAVRTFLHRSLIREDDDDCYLDDDVARRVFRGSWIDTAAAIMAEVADTLHRIHRAGIVHRDVKPDNIMLKADGTVMLTDFGLARADGLPSLTLTGEFAGTPAYAAPEQVSNRVTTVDHRADIFSFGATLYELLTGESPFDGDSVADVVQLILRHEPADPRTIDDSIPADLAAIVMKALAKARQRRYATAAEVAADLRRFLAGTGVHARPTAWLARTRSALSGETARLRGGVSPGNRAAAAARALAARLPLLLWATWVGGLAFYAAVVVPQGASTLGSHTEFGFVTRHVTVWLNAIGCAVGAVAALRVRRQPPPRPWLALAVFGAAQAALLALHPVLDGRLDDATRAVANPESFYLWHRLYLLTSAAQWLAAIAFAPVMGLRAPSR